MGIEYNAKTGEVRRVEDQAPEIVAENPEVAALRRKYLDATAALCALAGVEYTGKLENTRYDTVCEAASSHPQAGVFTATLVYCRACLREIEGPGWWDGITGT